MLVPARSTGLNYPVLSVRYVNVESVYIWPTSQSKPEAGGCVGMPCLNQKAGAQQ